MFAVPTIEIREFAELRDALDKGEPCFECGADWTSVLGFHGREIYAVLTHRVGCHYLKAEALRDALILGHEIR